MQIYKIITAKPHAGTKMICREVTLFYDYTFCSAVNLDDIISARQLYHRAAILGRDTLNDLSGQSIDHNLMRLVIGNFNLNLLAVDRNRRLNNNFAFNRNCVNRLRC